MINIPLMNISVWKYLVAFLFIMIVTNVSLAQDLVYPSTQLTDMPRNPGRSLDLGTSQLGFWAGYSPDNSMLIGRKTDRPFFDVNVQYAYVVITGNNWALKYIAEVVPVAIIEQPQQGHTMSGHSEDLPGSKQNIYGAGISPFGLQMNLRRGSILQPYINGTAGVIYFTDKVPVEDSSNFNFMLGLGAGVEIWYRENQSLIFGYKYQHISNAGTAPQNPGVDSNLFYIGFTWSWRQ
jgi:opacity protein-like surface antigen